MSKKTYNIPLKSQDKAVLWAMSVSELDTEIATLEKSQTKAKMEAVAGKLENPSILGHQADTIAVMKTIRTQVVRTNTETQSKKETKTA